MKKKFLYSVFALILAFGAGCSSSPRNSGSDNNSGGTSEEPSVYHRTVKKTDKKIWEGQSQVIVLPDDCGEFLEYAGLEFMDIFQKATELTPELEYESEVTIEEENFYYFIGPTEAIKKTDLDISYELLGDSGVVISTSDNTVYLSGATEKGTLYAVYEYMDRAFDYEFYADGEVYIGDGTDADWLDFDYVYRPSIANPCLMAGELNSDEELYYKYRFQNYYQTWMAKNSDVYYAHTYFKILPPEKYQEDHPNWYSNEKNDRNEPAPMNLCLTRDPAMIDTFVENCKEIIESDGEHHYFMLGQEDNFVFCDCPSCTERIAQLGGFSSAVMMEFTNEVVRRLNAWLETEHPDRNITFVTFAYNHTKTPPVVYNEDTKQYVPVSDTVKAEKNVSVQYVINMCDYYAPYEDSKSIVAALDGWSAVTDNITIWEYSTNFNNYVDSFDNFNSMAANIRLLSEHGVDYIVEQSAYNTCTTAFSELRLYLWSKLMWDASLDTKELIDDFMFYYYKEASDDMKAYFDEIYTHVDELVATKGVSVRSGGDECMTKQNWSYTTLTKIKNHIEDAYASIEGMKNSNSLRYNLLCDRIEKQELWVDYYLHKWYAIYLEDPDGFYNEWKAKARSHGLTMLQEGLYI